MAFHPTARGAALKLWPGSNPVGGVRKRPEEGQSARRTPRRCSLPRAHPDGYRGNRAPPRPKLSGSEAGASRPQYGGGGHGNAYAAKAPVPSMDARIEA